jgi:hypothetical protein
LPGKSENVMFLCLECDAKLEKELSGQFLNELCDCDVYTRWICVKCVKGEQRFTWDYYDHHTGFDHDGSTKALEDDPRTRDVWLRSIHYEFNQLIAISFTAFVANRFQIISALGVHGVSGSICQRASDIANGKRLDLRCQYSRTFVLTICYISSAANYHRILAILHLLGIYMLGVVRDRTPNWHTMGRFGRRERLLFSRFVRNQICSNIELPKPIVAQLSNYLIL